MSLTFSKGQLQEAKEVGTGVLGLVLPLLQQWKVAQPFRPPPAGQWFISRVLVWFISRSVVTILPYSPPSVQLRQKDEITSLSVSPAYHPAFLRLALQPLLFQCSFATELLRCQTLLVGRIQGAAARGSQEMEARARLTTNHLPLANIYGGPPLGKIPITFVQGVLHLICSPEVPMRNHIVSPCGYFAAHFPMQASNPALFSGRGLNDSLWSCLIPSILQAGICSMCAKARKHWKAWKKSSENSSKRWRLRSFQ